MNYKLAIFYGLEHFVNTVVSDLNLSPPFLIWLDILLVTNAWSKTGVSLTKGINKHQQH